MHSTCFGFYIIIYSYILIYKDTAAVINFVMILSQSLTVVANKRVLVGSNISIRPLRGLMLSIWLTKSLDQDSVPSAPRTPATAYPSIHNRTIRKSCMVTLERYIKKYKYWVKNDCMVYNYINKNLVRLLFPLTLSKRAISHWLTIAKMHFTAAPTSHLHTLMKMDNTKNKLRAPSPNASPADTWVYSTTSGLISLINVSIGSTVLLKGTVDW